jgi:hypothetical protein
MTATLEEARPLATPRREDGEFVDLGWRPVFKEHINRAGQRFDRRSMERIAERCNDRIKDGDFAPIVVRHTKDDGSFDPEVVGLAGPFKCQKLPGQNGKWAVYARWRIYKEDASKPKKYPRVSVEYWADENDPTGGYFDPISMLGAETPELDLGIHYAADPNDPTRRLMRYAKVMRFSATPGGGPNTFPPSGTEIDDKEKRQRYQGGTLSPDDIQQIIAALKPVIDEAVDAKVSAINPVGADPDGLLTDEVPPEHAGMPGEPVAELPGAEPFPEFNDGAGEPGAGEPGSDNAEEGVNPSGALPGALPGDDPDEDAEGDDEDTDIEPIDGKPAGKAKKKKKGKKPDAPDQYAKVALDGQSSDSLGELNMATETSEQTVARYQKESADYKKQRDEAAKQRDDVAKERDEYKVKYQKEVDVRREAETNHAALAERVAKIEASERRAVRYQKLGDLQNKGIVLDPDEEFKDCEDMNEAQFDKHCERIAVKYSKVPLRTLASKGLQVAGPSRTDSDDRKDAAKRDRYSKVAMDNVQAARKRGEKLDFKPEYERLLKEDPEKLNSAAA